MTKAAPLDKRGHFIAARKGDLFEALLGDLSLKGADAENARRFYRILTATLHYEYLDELETLHDAYHTLDPGRRNVTASPTTEAAYSRLSEAFERVLKGANFIEVGAEELAHAATRTGRIQYRVSAGTTDYRAIRLFRRGQHVDTIERVSWWGLKKEKVALEIYDEVVLLAALKAHLPERKKRRGARRPLRPGSVMIKCFHDIAAADLDALYPEVRVVMTARDQLMLGVPALLGGIPLLIKLAPAVFVLYGLLRFYTGEAQPSGDSIGEALLVASALLALGGFMVNQWMKYERRALRYQREVNETIYFHNVTNNIGMFDRIIGIAEEQDCKEALLAYFFLLTAETPPTQPELDAGIEAWLERRFGIGADFEVDDVLARLERFGILVRSGATLAVLPLPEALAALDQRWDEVFQFARVA